MTHGSKIGLSLAIALFSFGIAATAAEREERPAQQAERPAQRAEHPAAPAGTRQAEHHEGPKGYKRVTEPEGWNKRPAMTDKRTFQHNYQAARSYRIGPYHPPAGWTPHRWTYGEILPRAYWAPEYLVSDYWLFGLEVPPGGAEWVRDGADAILVDVNTGEILQVEYGVFA